MTPLSNLDRAELLGWLTRVTQIIDRSLRDTSRAAALAMLRADLDGTTASVPVLAQLALLDDCLRVGHLALDGATPHDVEPADAARPTTPGAPDQPGDAASPDDVMQSDGADAPDGADRSAAVIALAAVTALAAVAAPKYFAVLPHYESFGDGAASADEVARFLEVHRSDAGVFGYASASPWRGLALVRHVERQTRNAAPLRELERMLVRLVTELFAGSSTPRERDVRRRLRELFEPPVTAGADPRDLAFCRPDGPDVFSSVAHGSQMFDRDPFDVESIHADAREVFHRQIVRATTPEQHQYGHGRTLLVLGDSGSGKTHLLRALRHQVHSQRLGYVGYLQMTSEVGDYARYVLRNLIDSLERPYDAPELTESGLLYLSSGLAEGSAHLPADDIERLRTAELTADELDQLVGGMIDQILRADGLGNLEPDLVHALLLLQRRDPAVQRRVIRFLRCEPLSPYEQRLLGGLTPREQPDDPMRTIQQLGGIAYELQLASLVLLVDQVEDAVPDGGTVARLQQAVDVLRAIADAVPSCVVVLACLDDFYATLKGQLSRSLVDRLENDPPPIRLASQRQRGDIEAMLARRLDHLYASFDVAQQDDDPLYPFTPSQVDAVTLFRARDAIARFHDFHEACVAAGAIGGLTAPPPPAVAALPPLELDRLWNDALAAGGEVAADDTGILALVGDALRGAAVELGLELTVRSERTRQLIVESKALAPRIVELCNSGAQGGHLGHQLDQLRALIPTGVVPIALRNSDFVFKPKSKIAKQVGELIAAGGRTVVLEERQLRAVHAARVVAETHPQSFEAWRRIYQPVSHLAFVRAILDLDRAPRPLSVYGTQPLPHVGRPPASPTPPSGTASQPIAFDPTRIRLGETTSARKESVLLGLDQLTAHVALLGSPGSGKTCAALSIVEQLLERDVPVLLVDRKGDLARYASTAWWSDPDAPERDRRAALRERIAVELFTPGNPAGRPLHLPVIPLLADATTAERDQLAKFAAAGLVTMMGYGTGTTHRHKQSVLQCAIQLHAEEREVTIDLLRETISRPDPELLARVGPLQRFFAPLSEDLHTLAIQRGPLLGGDGEPLDPARMLAAPGEPPRLSIINTSALTEVSVLQFWISRLLVELGRLARKRPSKALQGVVLFDDADAYIPAGASPPTKEPMFELLRRARAGGIGIVLAAQHPGDIDYKARDSIATWLVGRVDEDRAIDRMRNLLASYPSVAARLATQPAGHFFVLGNTLREVRADRPMLVPEPLPDDEIARLARSSSGS